VGVAAWIENPRQEVGEGRFATAPRGIKVKNETRARVAAAPVKKVIVLFAGRGICLFDTGPVRCLIKRLFVRLAGILGFFGQGAVEFAPDPVQPPSKCDRQHTSSQIIAFGFRIVRIEVRFGAGRSVAAACAIDTLTARARPCCSGSLFRSYAYVCVCAAGQVALDDVALIV